MAQLKRGRRSSVSTQSSSLFDGIRFFNPHIALDYLSVDWDKTTYPTVFKIVPAIEEDTKGRRAFQPFRYAPGPEGYNDWMAPLPCATRVGTAEQQSFVLYDPLDDTYDFSTNPYKILYSQIFKIAKLGRQITIDGKNVDTRSWQILFGSTVSRDAIAFSKPDRRLTFMAVVPVMSRDKVCVPEGTPGASFRGTNSGDKPVIISLTPQAAGSLLKQIELPAEKQGSSLASQYAYGDITDPAGGRLVVPYHNQKFDADFLSEEGYKKRTQSSLVSAEQEFNPDSFQNQNNRSFPGYEVALLEAAMLPHPASRSKVVKYSAAATIGKRAEYVLQNYRPIADYFSVPCHEEIMVYLARGFKDQPELLKAGLGDCRDLWTSEVRAILGNRTQVSAPGASVAYTDAAYEEVEDANDLGSELASRFSQSQRSDEPEKPTNNLGGVYDSLDDVDLDSLDLDSVVTDLPEEEDEENDTVQAAVEKTAGAKAATDLSNELLAKARQATDRTENRGRPRRTGRTQISGADDDLPFNTR